MHDHTLKEIDVRHGRVKGSAFRAFKRVRARLREGVDYHHLDARAERERIDMLRRAGRIYASSVNVVILSESGYRQVCAALSGEVGSDE